MNKIRTSFYVGLLFFFHQQTALADNVTLSDSFPQNSPKMAAAPGSCGFAAEQDYLVAGTISVSTTGFYEIADTGNLLGFLEIGRGVEDVIINIYQDNFNPANPATNRIASIDEGEPLALETGHSYVLVLQPYCENKGGVFGLVVRGTGTVSGAGFKSSVQTYGQHTQFDPTADFPSGIGFHSYDASAPMQAPASGIYYFGDAGINFDAGIALLVYENAFNPLDTSTNLAGTVSFAGSVNLTQGKTYIFVAVDVNDLGGNWQYTLFPPGMVEFNGSMRGGWVTSGVDGSGVMVDVSDQLGVLFFAWFTFPDAAAVHASKTTNTLNAETGTGPDAHLGSSDQRWLTGIGAITPGSNFMNIKYENTTGGIFNSTNPKPTTDSTYGTGTLDLVDCNHIVLSYNLPGGLSGSADMMHVMPGAETACLELVNAGPLVLFP